MRTYLVKIRKREKENKSNNKITKQDENDDT